MEAATEIWAANDNNAASPEVRIGTALSLADADWPTSSNWLLPREVATG